MPTSEKIQKVEHIKGLFESANSFFVTEYQGLNVADITKLRRDLRESKTTFLVAKNTLLRIAAKEAGAPEEIQESLTGPTAIAFCSDDPSAPAKILNDSFKAHDLPLIRMFVVDEQVHGPDAVTRLAELPSREILLSQLVAAVESPMTSLVSTLDKVFQELIGTIDALEEKKKSE